MFRVVIPARYGSSRLPGKVLVRIAGKPMIQWVYERACASLAREVIIATDDPRVMSAAQSFGAQAVMTAPTHASGSDRIAEVARTRAWADTDIVVNVQGDEPLLPPALIDQVASVLEAAPQAGIATLATPVESITEMLDPNAVKLVTDARGRALYFSRAPIPWDRDGAPSGLSSQRVFDGGLRHIGIYAYRVQTLLHLASLGTGTLEAREKLEQLRALENGIEIRVAGASERPPPDVNTSADLERVSALLRH
ncbi:MAG TPA: 3-deoxy-manno-octulosonate cytidylyltransferase [Steroidobacteraceae bacterium]|nr:3-deoxy-manno-octulosonate cytidylyltransferase [Steroidobacteraceae bacterium]